MDDGVEEIEEDKEEDFGATQHDKGGNDDDVDDIHDTD